MQQRRFLFFTIIILAILAVIGMYLARPLLVDQPLELPAFGEPVTIQVAVAPSIKPWVDQAARQFNQQGSSARVRVVEASGLIPANQFSSNPQVTPPAAWLAEASFMVDLARVEGLQQFEPGLSVAETPLAWGAFNAKQAAFEQAYGSLNWENIHAKAVVPNDLLTLVIASPRNSAEGLAALISAAAAQAGLTNLSAADIRPVNAWLTEIFRDNTRIHATPAQAFATQGLSVGDVGLLSLASWRQAGLPDRSDFVVTPLEPGVILNYPLVIWTGAPQAEQEAARAFRDFLLGEVQQAALDSFYLDPAGTAQSGVQTEGEAVQTLLRWVDQVLR